MSKTIEIFEDRITIQGDDTYQCSKYSIEGETELIKGSIREDGLTTVDVDSDTYINAEVKNLPNGDVIHRQGDTYINAEVKREDFLEITLSSTPFEQHITIPYSDRFTLSGKMEECGVPDMGGDNPYRYMPMLEVHTVYKDGEMSIESISAQGRTFTPDE